MNYSFFNWKNIEFGFLKPYIIAEIGVNHGGDIELAKKQIQMAKKSGAHAVKFQAYKAEKIASSQYSPYYWDILKEKTSSQFKLFSKYDSFGEEEYKILAAFCKSLEIDFACTPFDLEAVDYLEPLVPFYKIASADITNIPLLKKISHKQKPIILSVGASTWEEIDTAIEIIYKIDINAKIALLHCVLNYPTLIENAQMILQDELAKKYPTLTIGYSDHIPESSNRDFPALDMAVLRGAVIIEKHFTHDTHLLGNDHYHAFSPQGLEKWVYKLSILRSLYGNSTERNLTLEIKAINNARRRIFINKKKQVGDILKEEDIIALRSNIGIPIAEYETVIGQIFLVAQEAMTPLLKENIRN